MPESLHLRFDPDMHGVEERIAGWRSVMATFGDVLVDAADAEAFRAELDLYHLGAVLLADMTVARHTLVRNRAMLNRVGLDHVALDIIPHGRVTGSTSGQAVSVEAGDCILFDLQCTMRLDVEAARCLALIVPRAMLDQRLGYVAFVDGLTFRAGSVEARMLTGLVDTLVKVAPDLPDRLAASMGEAAVELLARCIGPDAPGPAREERKPTPARLHRFIERNLARADLGAALLCDEFKLSRPSLYRMLEPDGGVQALIRRRRAGFALRLLRADGNKRLSLDEAARQSGFTDAQALRRAMLETYGAPPQALRTGPLPADREMPLPHDTVSKWFDAI